MAGIWAADRAQRFYIAVALFGLAAIAVGFSTTYFIPIAKHAFTAPRIVHLHGAAAFTWVCLLLAQALLSGAAERNCICGSVRRVCLLPSSSGPAES